MAYLDTKLTPYNPKAYVPGGSSAKKARSIVAKGKIVPVPKKKNPYVKPTPGGGSQPGASSSSSLNKAGSDAQIRSLAAKPAVSTAIDVNYESDPTLARIKALGQQSVGDA